MRAPWTRIVIVTVAALGAAIFGVTRLFAAPAATEPAGQNATIEGLTTSVITAVWSKMDHDMAADAPGYQMPPQMMPGMPEQGKERLVVSVTVINTTDGTRPIGLSDEFALRVGEGGQRVTPHSDTFGDLPRLAAHNAVTGELFFDLAREDLARSPGWLEWTHKGTTTRLAIPLDGAAAEPKHQH
jgi:hypothetical protein